MNKGLLKFLSKLVREHTSNDCINRPVLLFSTTRKLELGQPLSNFDIKCLNEYRDYINR